MKKMHEFPTYYQQRPCTGIGTPFKPPLEIMPKQGITSRLMSLIRRQARIAPQQEPVVLSKRVYVNYSLNSLKGDSIGDYIGDYYRGY